MEWSGRAPAPPAISWSGAPRQGARHVPGAQLSGRRHRHRYRQELVPHRRPRSTRSYRVAAEVVARPGGNAARQPAAVPDRDGGLLGAHHLSRKLQMFGHDTQLMPAKYVRPYSKGQKNDFRDAEAIAEAVQRPTMKFVATKSAEQLDLQALHRVRERLIGRDQACTRLMMPGIGPIISSASPVPIAATIAPGSDWCRSRYRRATARSSAAY